MQCFCLCSLFTGKSHVTTNRVDDTCKSLIYVTNWWSGIVRNLNLLHLTDYLIIPNNVADRNDRGLISHTILVFIDPSGEICPELFSHDNFLGAVDMHVLYGLGGDQSSPERTHPNIYVWISGSTISKLIIPRSSVSDTYTKKLSFLFMFFVNRCSGAMNPLTFLDHANAQALLEATILAAVASPLVHRTVLTGQTDILGIFLDCSLEKSTNAKTTSASKLVLIQFMFSPHWVRAEARRSDFNYAVKGDGDISIIR